MSRKTGNFCRCIHIEIYIFKQQQPLETHLPNSTVSLRQQLHLAAGGTNNFPYFAPGNKETEIAPVFPLF